MSAPAKATFTPNHSSSHWKQFTVHFNPVSLQYTVKNTMKNTGGGNDSRQQVKKTSGTLTMEVIFDTTDSGEDVRTNTKRLENYMKPDSSQTPPEIEFSWGAYRFVGFLESYKETIDFFSADGVPLRATCNITLAQQELTFDPVTEEASGDSNAVEANDDASSTAARAGNADAGRAIAASNDQESMRDLTGDSLVVSDSIPLSPPTAFATGGASAGAGFGASAGAGIGASAGAGFGASAGAGIGASAGAGFGASAGAGIGGSAGAGFGASAGAGIGASAGAGFGASAGAGIGASAGAGFGASAGAGIGASAGAGFGASAGAGFSASAGASASAHGSASAGVSASSSSFAAGLHTKSTTSSTSASLNTKKLLPKPPSVELSTDGQATFQVGGKAQVQGSAGLRTDVGASTSARASLKFD